MVGNTLLLGIFWVNLGKWIHEISSQKDGGIIVSGLGAQIFLPFLGVEGGGGVGGGGGGCRIKSNIQLFS